MPDKTPISRGEVWLISFDPSIGGEIRKTRPAVVLSNNISNTYLNRLQVIPLSSQTQKLYPSECLVHFSESQSKAMADQLTTVSKKRLVKKIGTLKDEELEKLKRIVQLQLGLQ